MKQGISMTATINIIAIFLTVTFGFLVASLNYYKVYKVNNAIADSIEKYEGYNALAIQEINQKLVALGYVSGGGKCSSDGEEKNMNTSKHSYCIYEQTLDETTGKFKYQIVTFLNFKIPIVNRVLNIPVKTYTQPIYYFGGGSD